MNYNQFSKRTDPLGQQFSFCGTSYSREQLQRRIDATDAQIDRLVYDLYDLTEQEIRIVEVNA